MCRSPLIASLPLVFLLISCTESLQEPAEPEFPSKLYPYEAVYDAATYRQRRDALVGAVSAGSIVLVTTNSVYLRNGDVDYEFRPASTFFYLTGFEEPNAVAIIRPKAGTPLSSELIMFVEVRDAASAQWLGPTYGPEGAVQYFGADSAYSFAKLAGALGAYAAAGKSQKVYANLADNADVEKVVAAAGGTNFNIVDIKSIVDRMRATKSSLELGLLRRAVDVSVQAFREGMKVTAPGVYEYEVESIFDLFRRVNGCPRNAFPTIVASGPNVATIHYTANRRQMQSGDLVMIDFGAEYGYYAADLTRTLPVGGAFTTAQSAVYDIVLKGLDTVLAVARPGTNFWNLSYMCNSMMIGKLLERGIITGQKEALMSSYEYLRYIPAALGHPIGLDVHDPFPTDKTGRLTFREGMVLAIEPHLYLGFDDLTVDPAYRGVCVRLEDDILITATGCENLSGSLPRKRVEIESLMAGP